MLNFASIRRISGQPRSGRLPEPSLRPFFVKFNPFKGTRFVIFAFFHGHGGPYPKRPLASALSTRAHATFAVPRASYCARQAPSPPTPLMVLRSVGHGRWLMTMSGESSVVRVLGVPERK